MDSGRLTPGVISKRSLGGDPPREEVVCRARGGAIVRNIVRKRRPSERSEYAAVNGLWLPLGLPPPSVVPPVPPVVWQTHQSAAYVQGDATMRSGAASWERVPGLERRFHDDAERDAFVKEHFPEFWGAYTGLPLEVMKADLWRYMVLYAHGGIYADADTRCVSDPRALVSPSSYLVVVPEPAGLPYFCQWVFAASPRSPVMRWVLAEALRRLQRAGPIKPRSFAENPHLIHELTGPAMFTDAVRAFWASRGLPALAAPAVYSRYPSHLLKVLPVRFHSTTVRHASIGSTTAGGWQAIRDRLVARAGGVVPARRM